MALAREDLRAATEYTLALQRHGAEGGLVGFNALLVRLAMGTLAAIEARRPGNKLSRVEVLAILADVTRQIDQGQPRAAGRRPRTRISRPPSEPRARAPARCWPPSAWPRRRAPAAAKTRFFPLPMYTTVPNEGSTYGAMPVFMVADDNDPDRVQSITAPSLSWNSSAGVTGDLPLLPLLRTAPLLAPAAVGEHDHQPLALVHVRRRPPHAARADAERSWCGCAATSSTATSGSAPTRPPAGESSYTRLYAIASARVGWNLTSDLNLARLRRGPRRSDRSDTPSRACPRRRTRIQTRPGSTARPSSAAAWRFATTRASSATTRRPGSPAELTGNVARGITGVGRVRPARRDRARARARVFVPAGGGALLLDAGHRQRRAVLRSGEPGR